MQATAMQVANMNSYFHNTLINQSALGNLIRNRPFLRLTKSHFFSGFFNA